MEEAQAVTDLLTDLVNEDWGFPSGSPPRPFNPWGATGGLGIHIAEASEWFTPEIAEWFRQRGWLAVTFKTDVFVARIVEVLPPAFCYHVTPDDNEAGILERGLLRGEDAGRSTTGRPDASRRIHVTLDADAAAKWSEQNLLGNKEPGKQWVVFQIDRRGIEGKVFRDPASQTGYILETAAVASGYLKVVRRLKASDPPAPG